MNKLFKTELEIQLVKHGFDETSEKHDWTLTQLNIEELERTQKILMAAIATIKLENIKLENRIADLKEKLS